MHGRLGDALKTVDSALWTAVGRFDWVAVAAIEHLLTAMCPSTAGKDRRRCEYLLHAARENLRANAPSVLEAETDDIRARITRLEREIAGLHEAIAHGERRMNAVEVDVRTLLGRSRRETATVPAPRRAVSPPSPAAARPQPPAAVPPASTRPAMRAPAPPRPPVTVPRPPRDWSQVFGPRTLAWAGGIVTSLGIVFLYSLAVNHGWIGPVVRIATGAVASALVFSAGFWLHRRFGKTYAALGAAGAGIAGGYATLLASVALYELLPDWLALVVAAAIAGVGVGTALLWSAETVAGLGLVGAILVPLAAVPDLGITTLGTSFALVMFGASALVSLRRRWRGVLVSATAASAPQLAALVLDRGGTELVVLAGLFALAYLSTALAWHRAERVLGSVAASLVLVSGSVASLASQQLFSGDARGLALLVAAGAYGAVAAPLVPSARRRDLSSLLAALALALAAVGLAQVISGQALAIAWAAEAAVLAWLARRLGEERYQLGALAYLALAVGHALYVDAPLSDLFRVTADPADGVPTVVAVVVAALALARQTGGWRDRAEPDNGLLAPLAPLFAALRGAQPLVRAAAIFATVAGVAYAVSLAVLEVAQRLGPEDVRTAFERGHAAVDAAWSGLALVLLAASLLRRQERLGASALALYAALFAKAALFDAPELAETPRGLGLLAIAISAVLAGFLWQRLAVGDTRLDGFAAALLGGSVAFGVPAALDLADGHVGRVDLDAVALLALAAGYGVLAVLAFGRERDLSSALSGVALALVGWGFWEFLAGTWLVLAWTAVAALVALLSVRTRDLRFLLASSAYVGLALVHVLTEEAPPRDLFVSQPHPGGGVPALLALAAAGLVFGLASSPRRRTQPPHGDDPYGTRGLAFALESRLPRWRVGALAGAAIVAVFALSLAILEAAEAASNVSVETAFQRGHTGVSAFWGVLGLALLYLGLVRGRSALRGAGLGLFAVTLAKIFLYDLSALSAIARALSFLAVGVLLLAAGFFYQRLTGRMEEREIPAQ